MNFTLNDRKLVLFFEGELNSANAIKTEEDIEATIANKEFDSLELNFEKLTYISSAGLRIILKLKSKYPNTIVTETCLQVYDILSMTGFVTIMTVRKALRTIDVSNATIVGQGYFSTVYRIDRDTIVKVFNRTADPDQIERELRLAKEAFVLGIPTAISFDVVRVGAKLGVCFEMLDCASLQDVMFSDREHWDENVKKYADLLLKINSTECFDESIPSIKDHFLKKVEVIKPALSDAAYEKLKKVIQNVEDRRTLVHGDCHLKNIMVQNGEFLLIDMDTLSVGHPIFEFAGIYAPYVAFDEDDPGNSLRFFGVDNKDMVALYNQTLNYYFGKDDPLIKDKIRLVSYLHMCWWNRANEPENDVRFNGCKGRLLELLDRIDDVNF